MITSGEGRYQVWLEKKKVGHDLLYILGGGEQPHLGGVVICQPENIPQIIRLGTHHDHVVLEPIAKRACEKYHATCIAVGGIHIDDATKDEIDMIIANCKNLHDRL
jgi:gallate decarboxylase subunit D